MNLYYGNENNMNLNLFVIYIQFDEGIMLYLNVKKFGGVVYVQFIKFDYCSNCNDELNIFEVYEKLIYDCFFGDVINFVYWDEVVFFWNFVDFIFEIWVVNKILFFNYELGFMGLKELDDFLVKDGLYWWNI